MSSWGNKDDIASPGTVSLSGLTVTGSGTFFANNYSSGQVIEITGAGDAVINAITNATSMTIVSNTEITVGSIAGAAYTVSEKPVYVIDTDTNIVADDVFGVSVAELDGGAGVATIAVTAAGTGYTVRPTVSIGGDGSGATATATAKVVTFTVANTGTGYSNGDIITVAGGTGTSANATVTTGTGPANTEVASLALISGGSYTVLPTLTNNISTTDGSGTGIRVNLSMGVNDITVTLAGSNYTSAPVTIANTGGLGGGATATATLQSSDRSRMAHAGWVHFGDQYTDANGNTRQKTEVLVAMSTITNDADDDTGDVALPE